MGKRCPQIVHFKKGASMKTIHFFGYHHDGNSGTCGFGCSKGECGTGITMARNSPPRVPRVFSSERPEMLRLLPGNKSEVNPIIKCYNWFKIEYSPEKRKKQSELSKNISEWYIGYTFYYWDVFCSNASDVPRGFPSSSCLFHGRISHHRRTKKSMFCWLKLLLVGGFNPSEKY